MNKAHNSSHRFIGSMIFIGFLMPVIAFWLINAFFAEQNAVAELQLFRNLADNAAQQLEPRSDNSEFWCHELNRHFASAETIDEFVGSLKMLAKKHDENICWVLWNADSQVVAKNIVSRHSDASWNRVGKILKEASKAWYLDIDKADDSFVRSVLGEHLQTKTFVRATFRNNPSLNSLSFFRPAGSFWADFSEKSGAIVLFPPGIEKKNHGIKEFLKDFNLGGSRIALGKDGFFFANMPEQTPEKLLLLKKSFAGLAPEVHKNATGIHTGRFVGKDLFFCLFKAAGKNSAGRSTLLFSVVLAFFWVLVFNRILHEKLHAGISIRYVVIALITCSNVFPLLIMGILGQQYIEQKRQILIEERRSESVKFLRQIEGEFIAATHKIKNFAIQQIDRLGETLRHEPLSLENTSAFRKSMAQVAGKFMVVASTTYPSVSDVVFMGKDKAFALESADPTSELSLEFIENADKSRLDRVKLNQTMCKCGAAFIAFYNGSSLAEQVLTEVELIIEAIFQTKLHATFHKFLRLLENVEHIGMGTEKHPTFMHFLSFNPENLADYLFMFHFNQGVHASNYMTSMHSLFQRNIHGIRVVYSQGQNLKNLEIAPFTERLKLRELFARLTSFPQPQAELVELDGQTWVSVGFVSKVIGDNSLIALSPVDETERRLSIEKRQLFAIMLINILLVAGITLIFVQTLIKPVSLLQTGTEAIRNRNFAFRIPWSGKDEFGRMARVFNSALDDLQEMTLARDVQQQLFPKQQVETGHYDLFCKTITMADLGGDYLDTFQLDDEKFVMVLGDVAGHGVGAAMIMAMAKSAMLNSTELLDRPAELLNRLHDLIYRTKSKKQKKIMTFQYVMVDTREHKVVFSNAGGCNPYIVRVQSRAVEELTVPGAALGSFKNAKFSQCEVNLEPGDAIVLYTDGLVESRNDHGEELGYEKFKNLLCENHCAGSQQFYERIMAANRLWRQNQPPQDDYSLMILGRRPA